MKKTLLFLIALLAFGQTVWTQNIVSVNYVDENGTTQNVNATSLDAIINAAPNTDKDIGYEGLDNWFVLEGNNVVLNGQLGYNGNLNLILCDGAKLTINKTDGDAIASLDNTDTKYTLTIYVQAGGTGQLVANASSSAIHTENLTIHGGVITATGGTRGIYAPQSNIVINGGTVTAVAPNGNAIEGYNVTINGGIVSATGNGGIQNGMTGTTTLGYTKNTDRIFATNYLLGYTAASVKVKDGQYMITDNGVIVYGSLNEDKRNAIAGHTLSPYTPTEWAGHGESDDPYIIASVNDLNLLSLRTNGGSNDYSDKYYKLGNNITFTASSDWNDASSTESNFTAIGSFSGHFDGDVYTISGLRIRKDDGVGLFSYLAEGAVVENITLSNSRVTGNSQIGGIVGSLQPGATVNNCHVTNTVYVYSKYHFTGVRGGVVGYSYSGTISNCVSEATIGRTTEVWDNTNDKAGGIVGVNESGTLTGNLVIGANITCQTENYGAIAGNNANGTLTNNYYHACTVNGTANTVNIGVNGADITTSDGAMSIHTITKPNDVTITTDPTLVYGGTNYWKYGTTITLNGGLDDTPTEGWQKAYFVNGTANTSDPFTPSNTFTITPARDIEITIGQIHGDWANEYNNPSAGSSSDNPYKIYFTDQLDLLATRVNNGTTYDGKYFKLMDNLTYSYNGLGSDESNYTPIGSDLQAFHGHFDGNNKSVSGIRIRKTGTGTDACYLGLFGSTDRAEVKDVTIKDTQIVGHRYLGGVVGHSWSTMVSGCHVWYTVSIFLANNDSNTAGGIVGYNRIYQTSTVTNCTSEVHIHTNTNSQCYNIGGIVGLNGSVVSNNFVMSAYIDGGSHFGAVVGQETEASALSNNYYRNCVVNNLASNVGCDGADVADNDGAVGVYTITINAQDVILSSSNEPMVTYQGTDYWKSGQNIALEGGLNGTPAPGYQKAYFINGEAVTENTFVMPANDVSVTVGECHADWETANAGTEDDPYLIYFTDQLDLLATRVNDGTAYHAYADKYFKLMNDLTYSYEGLGATESNFTAIGGYNNHFSGHFNGNNKTISGIRIYKGGTAQAVDDYQGLFGYIDSWYPHGPGDVKNLTLNDAVITGRDCVGGIVGRLNAGTVDSCHVTSSVFIHSVASDDIYCHGGIVGQLINTPSVVSHCTSSATLTANQNATYIRYFGGIVGGCNNSTLTDNFAIGAIIPGATESYHNGAIAGSVSYGTVERNYYQGCKVESTNVTPSGVGCGGYNVDPYDITEEDGAVPVFTISVANGISFTATPTFTYDEINYYKEGVPVTLSGGMDVTVPVGYQRRYYLNEVPFNGNTFNMPAANANITVATELIDWEVEYAGSEENPYLIYNEEQWDLLAERVNSGHSTYQDKFFKLMADFINHIDYSQVETMVGNSTEHTFNGTFDGNGHELFCIIDNVKKENGLGNYTAPFRYVNGATFKHMYLSGHVTSSYKYNGGIVAHSQGTVNIIDCRVHSSVRNDMDFPWNADGTDSFHGGFVAHISSGSVSFEGCVFDGWFLSGCDIRNGGFVGQTDSGVSVSLRNCIFAPNAVNGHDAHTGNTTFVRLSSGVTSSMTNCYYNNVAAGTCPTKQGLQARSINGGEDVVVTYTGTPIEYNRANVTSYTEGNADLIGLKWNDVLYAGKNETMAINLQFTGELPEHNVPVYTVSNATLNGTESPFTLNMGSSTDAAVVISCNNAVLAWEGHGTEDDPYLIHTNEQWDLLAEKVNTDNKTYSGIYFKLMADITISYTIDDNYPDYLPKLVGYDENHSFQGTFDGNNHKITLDYYDQTYVDVCAPFRFVKNATIKRLLVDGEIQKEYKKNVASIVGDSYGTTNLISCYSEAGVYNHKGNHTNYPDERDGTSGGLVGRVSGGTINLTNCSYNGKFAGTSGTLPGGCTTYTTKWGGLVAYVAENCTANLINCFCEIRVELWVTDGSEYFARKHNNATVNLINCYRSDKLEYPNPGDTNKVFPNSDQGIDATNMTDEELHNALGYAWMTYASTYHDHHVLPITAPQTFTGEGTEGSPYQIASAADWDKFAIYVAHKDSRSSDYFQMTNNISTTNMVGLSDQFTFQGTFDGAGNTLNLDYNVTYMPDNKAFSTAAPFAYISNAAIQDLHIMGNIATVGMRPASVAGFVVGNSSITNCKSEVALSSSYDDDIDAGGFVARVNEDKSVTLTGCLFTGSITYNDPNGYEGGGIVGWTQDNATATLTDCVFAPSAIHITKFVTNNDDKKHRMFVGGKERGALIRCYYNDVAAASGMVAEGERVYSIVPGQNVTMQLYGIATDYTVSGITIYGAGDKGLKFDDVFHAVSGNVLDLGLGVTVPYTVTNYFANGDVITFDNTGNNYTLTMPNEDVTITATFADVAWDGYGTEESPYLIYYNVQWDLLATNVNAGNNYSGVYFKLMDDISVETMVGSTNRPFRGIFDGGGHTLTFNKGTEASPYDQNFCAPFKAVEAATIKNLHTTGAIYTSAQHAAGFVAQVIPNSGNFTRFYSCRSSMNINSTVASDAGSGGFIGSCSDALPSFTQVSNRLSIYFDDCLFDGEFSGTATGWGGFIGYYFWCSSAAGNSGMVYFSRCLFAPSAMNISTTDAYNFVRQDAWGWNEQQAKWVHFHSSSIMSIKKLYYTITCGNSEGYATSVGNMTNVQLRNALGDNWMIVTEEAVEKVVPTMGNVVTRVIAGYGDSEESDKWAFIASPVTTQGGIAPSAVGNLLGSEISAGVYDFDLYRFNPLVDLEWENYHRHNTTEAPFMLVNGMGYLYATKETKTLTFTGTFNTDNSKTLENLPAGFNLVGNPFTVDAYVDRPFYQMNNEGSDIEPVENYDSYSPTTIPMCTGIMVKAEAEGESVTFSTTAPNQKSAINNGSLQMTLTKANGRSNDYQDKAIVSFNEGTKLEKFIFNEKHAKLYIPQDGEDYAIANVDRDARPCVSTEIPVHFKATETGKYTITFNGDDMDGVKFVDKFENTVIDLDITDCYTFIGSVADSRDRFVLVFGDAGNASDNDIFAYQNGSDIIVTGEGTLEIYDVMGRKVSTQRMNGVETISAPAQGVYIFRLVGNGIKTQKIVVR